MLTPGVGVLGGSAFLWAPSPRIPSLPSASLASDPQGVLYQYFRASASAGMCTEAAPQGPQALAQLPRAGQLPFPGLDPDSLSPGPVVIWTGYPE